MTDPTRIPTDEEIAGNKDVEFVWEVCRGLMVQNAKLAAQNQRLLDLRHLARYRYRRLKAAYIQLISGKNKGNN